MSSTDTDTHYKIEEEEEDREIFRSGSKSDSGDHAKQNKWDIWLHNNQKAAKSLEYLKKAFYFLLALAIFLGTGAVIGATMYVAIVAMPAIAASFSAAVGLATLPQALILAVAALMLIGTLAVAWRWMELHWKYYTCVSRDKISHWNNFKATLTAIITNPLGYARGFFIITFVKNDKSLDDDRDDDPREAFSGDNYGKRTRLQKYHLAALVASLGLGIYLAVYVVPFVMATAMASLGLPFGVAVLLGTFAAVAVIAMTYELLAFGMTLSNLYHTRDALKKYEESDEHHKHPRVNWENFGYTLAGVVGVTAAAGSGYLFFIPLVNVLTPVLGTGMATFAALAVTVSLAVVLMYLLPAVSDFVVKGVKMVRMPEKNSEYVDHSGSDKHVREKIPRFWKRPYFGLYTPKTPAPVEVELKPMNAVLLAARSESDDPDPTSTETLKLAPTPTLSFWQQIKAHWKSNTPALEASSVKTRIPATEGTL